ncbi:regulatory helix-turn-helix protein, lysR family [Ferrimonas sediminum]|uniref:Regulatory helix-turn-helix protein, lysR family n=1 Tax=Ferrimonas sediminum TaxID=718193 RepID=A0A1G8NHX5_9GAMM|nr:LysR family transcriptional regulator [Ferrimonas sediminum]SDI79849.1 regulatory helix-turn-helix protein, lysR family [Ferrimonas sediminum]
MKHSIDIKFLKTFACVADKRSYSDAAATLFMTQPAVSQHVKKVEQHFGKRLLEKSAGLRLTREGQLVFLYAQKALRLQDEMMSEFAKLGQQQSLSIAIDDGLSPDLVVAIARELSDLSSLNLTIRRFSAPRRAGAEEMDLVMGIGRPADQIPARDVLHEQPLLMQYSAAEDGSDTISRIFYSSALEQQEVNAIAADQALVISDNCLWVQAAAAPLLEDGHGRPEQLLIAPPWSLPSRQHATEIADYRASFYLRASQQFRKHFDMYDLTDRIGTVVKQHTEGQ